MTQSKEKNNDFLCIAHRHTKELKPLAAGSCRFREFSGSFAATRESVEGGQGAPPALGLSGQLERHLKTERLGESKAPLKQKRWLSIFVEKKQSSCFK